MTDGLTQDDRRLPKVLALLEQADDAHKQQEENHFRFIRSKIMGVMK